MRWCRRSLREAGSPCLAGAAGGKQAGLRTAVPIAGLGLAPSFLLKKCIGRVEVLALGKGCLLLCIALAVGSCTRTFWAAVNKLPSLSGPVMHSGKINEPRTWNV